MRHLLTGDLEATEARLPALDEAVFGEGGIMDTLEGLDHLILGGDLVREYTPGTVGFLRRFIQAALIRGPVTMIVGNHDRTIGTNILSATFENWSDYIKIIDRPTIHNGIAYLPAPDRTAFGALREAEGPRARDEALSDALKAAIRYLHSTGKQAGHDIGSMPLVYHATLDAQVFGNSPSAKGLTWTIPASEVALFGMGLGFHIHKPADFDAGKFGAEIHTVGSPVPDTFAGKDVRPRIGILESINEGEHRTLKFTSHPLRNILRRVEIDIRREGERIFIDGPAEDDIFFPDISAPCGALTFYIDDVLGIKPGENVAIKINAYLPESDLARLPHPDSIKGDAAWGPTGIAISEVILRKIPTGLIKTRLDKAEREGITPDRLLTKWAETSGYDDRKIIEIALSLMGEDEEFDKWNDAGLSGFEPIRTRISNFRQYKETEIEWADLEGTVSIRGENATGKSNLLDATIFGLYKRTPSTSSIDDELRRGQDAGYVEVEFLAGSRTYLVRRSLERAARGTVSCKSELFELTPDDQGGYNRSAICETARDIDAKIADLIGAYDYVISTFFASAAQIDALTRATPAEWRRHVTQSLSLDTFERFRERASKKARGLSSRTETIAAQVGEVEPICKKKAAQRQEIGDLDDWKAKLSAAEDRIKDAEATLSELARQAGEAGAEEKDLLSRLKKAQEAESRRQRAEKELKDAEATLEAIDVPDSKSAPPAVDDLSLPDLSSMRKERDEARKAKDEAAACVAETKHDLDSALRRAADYRTSIESAEKRLEEAISERDKAEGPPCEDLACGDLTKDICHAWQEFVGSKHIESIEAGIVRLKEGLAKAGVDEEAAGESLESAKKDLFEAESDLQEMEARLAESEKREREYDKARAARMEWEAKIVKIDAAVQRIQEATVALQKIEAAAEEADTIKSRLEKMREASVQRTAQERDYKLALSKERNNLQEAERKIQAAVGLDDEIEDLRTRLADLEADRKALSREADGWTLLERAFHSTGIPFLLIEEALPEIAREANRLLAVTDLSVSIRSMREKKDGSASDDILVRYIDPRGEFDLCKASGAQEKLLGFCLRFALAKVGGNFWGSPPGIYVQDEGFGAFDPTRYDQVREIISLIAADFKRFVYITHVTALAADADIQFRTAAGADCSEIERIV